MVRIVTAAPRHQQNRDEADDGTGSGCSQLRQRREGRRQENEQEDTDGSAGADADDFGACHRIAGHALDDRSREGEEDAGCGRGGQARQAPNQQRLHLRGGREAPSGKRGAERERNPD